MALPAGDHDKQGINILIYDYYVSAKPPGGLGSHQSCLCSMTRVYLLYRHGSKEPRSPLVMVPHTLYPWDTSRLQDIPEIR
jgi:hypothetical protein